jgi:DNA polymerase-3 subunit gamma/tau
MGEPAVGGQTADTHQGGSYSYPDDDWGPPLDEDAPPLDEEPPMDWEPSPRSQPRNAPSVPDVPHPAPVRVPATSQGVPATGQGQAADPSGDPWSRAVEQAPGIWLLGSESNVGKYADDSDEGQTDAPPQTSAAPRYEPAAAQVPPAGFPSVGFPSAGFRPAGFPADPAPAGDSGTIPVQTLGNGSAPAHVPAEHPSAEPDERMPEFVPAYAMASAPGPAASAAAFAPTAAPSSHPRVEAAQVAAPAGVAPTGAQAAAHGTAAAPAPAVAGNGKLSLYQRLSNSPEAEAGRAKAPARRVESAESYPQDIPSADDETIEESGVFGRAAVERILGGKLIEERSLDGSPLLPRY